MAEKTVAVRLVARVDAYTAAMAKAAAATGAFSASSQANLTKVGSQMQSVGRNMTTFLTLPIVGVGAVATKMAMDFDTAFGQIQALTNVSASEIDGLKESVLELSGSTAKSPQELAEALYFAASAGLDSAAALDVVTMSAQASAAGMGQTEDVTKVLAAALNVYGESNLSAAEAADILTAAVQEGSAAPEEYAESLGNVLPIAAQMGITFDEVAGSVAFLTNQGLDGAEAVTALRGTLLAIMAPGLQATKTLEEYGLSAAELQAAIDQDGLLGALELLRDSGLAGNSAAMSKLFEDNRALVGATSLLADANGTLVPILNATENSAGSLGDAFSETADTDAFKMRQSLADVQTAMVKLGSVLLPIAAGVAGAIADLVTWFAQLPGPVQAALGGFVGLAAALGPIIFIAGSLIKNIAAIRTAMLLLGGTAGTMSLAFAGIAAAAMIGYAAYQAFSAKQDELEARVREVGAALTVQWQETLRTALAAEGAEPAIAGLAAAEEALAAAIVGTGEDGVKTTQALGALGLQTDYIVDAFAVFQAGGADTFLRRLAVDAGFTGDAMVILTQAVGGTDDNAEALTDDLYNAAIALEKSEEEASALTRELLPAASAMAELKDQVEKGDLNKFVTESLNAAAAVSEEADQLIRLAEEQTGATRAGEEAYLVWLAFNGLLAESEQTTQDAVLETQEFTVAQDALMEATGGVIPLIEGEAAALGEIEEPAITGAEAMEVLAGSFEDFQRIAMRGGDRPEVAAEFVGSVDAMSEALAAYTSQAGNYLSTQDDIHRANLSLTESYEENGDALVGNTEEALKNRAALMSTFDAVVAHAQAQLESGDSVEHVTDTFKTNRDAMIEAAVAAGYERDEVEKLVDQLGLADADWTAVIKISGDAIAMKKLEALLLEKEDLTKEDVIRINTDLQTGGAWYALNNFLARARSQSVLVDVYANTAPARRSIGGLSGYSVRVPVYSIGHSAEGRYVSQPMLSTLAEAGPEVVLPLTNAGRMAALLGDPRVFGPVAAAMAKLVPNSTAMTMGGGGYGGSSVTNQNVTVIMPPGSNGDDVVRALRKWERRSGPVPISVR